MNGYVDLHLHTTYSDGIVSPAELVKLAAEKGVGVLAVTDHDSIGGMDEAFVTARDAGVKIVAGVEVSTNWYGKAIHITVYGFDRENVVFRDFLKQQNENRKNYFVGKLESLNAIRKEKGLTAVSIHDFTTKNGSIFNGTKTAEFLIKQGLALDITSAEKILAPLSSDQKYVSPEEAIAVAHGVGAVACLAHPFAPRISLKKIDPSPEVQKKLIVELKAQGLDGMECFQASHSAEETKFAQEIAKELDLLVSGGSDWHGPLTILGDHMLGYIPYYCDFPGGLKTPIAAVSPLLERLGVVVDKV
jgi:3',5'-nucleoside bisphosphate phosphatase